MFQFILDQALSDNRSARVFEQLRRQITKRYDPIVHYQLNGQRIALNFSHQLPLYRKLFPTYSANLTRLTAFLRSHFGTLSMIDVGANIGDSYCLSGPRAQDEYLLIEGDSHYYDLLIRNTQHTGDVTCVQAFLSDKNSISNEIAISEDGNARIVRNNLTANTIHYQTLDEIIANHPKFASSNLLKTDVEGFDCKVLCGGLNYIKTTTPVIFFEHHPRLLALAGEDDGYIFNELASLGYSYLIFYDNTGFLLGTIPSDNVKLINDLNYYAKQKSGYYYDICCFNDKCDQERDDFAASEKAFYARLSDH